MLHPHSSDAVDVERQAPAAGEGVYLDELERGAVVELETKNHHYTLVKGAAAEVKISGHPTLCPEPVTVQVDGSRSSDLGMKSGFIGCGMHLIFEHPSFHTVTTSRILKIHRIG